MSRPPAPMRIDLTEDRRDRILVALKTFFISELDQEISDFQAGLILDFFVREVGAPVYNQAIQDARRFLHDKLEDLEGEFYEPDEG